LAYPRLDVAGIIGREKLRESKFARELRREGEIHGERTMLLKMLHNRFGEDIATELTPAVNAVEDLGKLEHLFDQVLAGGALNEIRAALTAAGRAGSRRT
jgi:hypothetical protein